MTKGTSRKMMPYSRKRIPLATTLLSAGEAFEVSDDHQMIDIAELITKGREGFVAFIVDGDSMVDDIHPGFIVFVDTWAQPKNGDIVATSVNDATSVKIFHQSPAGGLFLVPKNGKYKPRKIKPSDSLHVLGVIRGHMKVYR